MTSQAVLIAVGIDWDGRRQILSVEMAGRESRSAWKDFLVRLKERGLKGVELVVSDDHAGLVAAIGEVIPEAAWQRCYVGLLKNQSSRSYAEATKPIPKTFPCLRGSRVELVAPWLHTNSKIDTKSTTSWGGTGAARPLRGAYSHGSGSHGRVIGS